MPPPLIAAWRVFALLAGCLAVSLLAHAADTRPEHAALPETEWKAIQRVIATQLNELRRGDARHAFEHATAALREQFGDEATFLEMVRNSYSALLTARRTEFLEGAVLDGATIQPLRLILPDETVLVALYRMEKENGRWHIAGCVIAASTVRST